MLFLWPSQIDFSYFNKSDTYAGMKTHSEFVVDIYKVIFLSDKVQKCDW